MIAIMICGMAGTLLLDILIPFQFRNIIDIISTLSPPIDTRGFHEVLLAFGILGMIYCGGIIVELTLKIISTISIPKIMRDIDNEAFEKVHSFGYDFFANHFVGAIVAQIRRFSDAYLNIEVELTENLFRLLVRCIAVAIMLYVFTPAALLPAVIWAVIFLNALNWLLKKKMEKDRVVSALDSRVTAVLADSITNFLVTKVFARQIHERRLFQDVTSAQAQMLEKSWMWSTGIYAMQTILNVTIQLIVLYMALNLWSQGEITLGTIVLIQLLLSNVSEAFIKFADSLKQIYRCLAKAEEMLLMHELEPEIKDPINPEKANMPKGHIVYDSVQFAYADHDALFDEFNLEIKPGQKVGLVGPSGSGKSSFVKLLLRFMDPQSGEITIDGQSIHHITQDDLRKAISYVPQEPVLFHRSLRDNIAYGSIEDVSDEAIFKAAKDAYIHDLITSLPFGYETLVGERGVKLSGGERQRVAIARAMLKKSPILVLDEATSSLDTMSEMYIQKAFQKLMRDRTTIVIAHRLSTIARLDRILVLEKGKIIEDGSHETLIKKKGLYATLYKNQKDGFLVE